MQQLTGRWWWTLLAKDGAKARSDFEARSRACTVGSLRCARSSARSNSSYEKTPMEGRLLEQP